MRTSCSRMAFWSDSLQRSSEISVTFQLQTCQESANPPKSGCGFILLHTRTSTHDLSRFRNDRHCSSTIRKERKHENVTRNRTCCSCARVWRYPKPKVDPR